MISGIEKSTKQSIDMLRSAEYAIQISETCADPAWDDFLVKTPGGHHVQTSLWAQVKAMLGWQAVRVVVTQGGQQIVAGAQMLIRPLSVMGAIGHVPKGPLVGVADPRLAQLVIDQLHQLAKSYRIRSLLIQPPDNGDALAAQLLAGGFQPSAIEIAQPTATALVDLAPDLDQILARMGKKTRYGIRRSQNEGLTAREGTMQDLSTFHRLLVATSERQGFSPYAEEYFAELWRVFYPHGYVKLFVVEYAGDPVSAHLVMPFGETVTAKQGGWSGQHGQARPDRTAGMDDHSMGESARLSLL